VDFLGVIGLLNLALPKLPKVARQVNLGLRTQNIGHNIFIFQR
jgi:hypothetical protein